MSDVGTCPECGGDFRLTKKGVLWHHNNTPAGVWPPLRCKGAGELPAFSIPSGATTEREHLLTMVGRQSIVISDLTEALQGLVEQCPCPGANDEECSNPRCMAVNHARALLLALDRPSGESA